MTSTACSNTAYPDGYSECGSLDELVDELRIMHGFRQYDVVLAIEAGESAPNRFSAGLAILDIERSEFDLPKVGEGLLQAANKHTENGLLAPIVESSADPVIRKFLTKIMPTNYVAD